MLKALITEAEHKALPESIQGHYAKQGDHYVLDVGEKEYKDKIKEFRDNNVTITQKYEQALKDAEKFKDIDPEKYQRAIDEIAKLEEIEDGELLKKGKTGAEQLVNKRLAQRQKDWEAQKKAIETERDTHKQQADRYKGLHGKLVVETQGFQHISNIAVPRKNSLMILANMLHDNFVATDDGKLAAKEGKLGPKQEPLTLEDFGKSLLADYSYLFEAATGGGAGGGNKKTGGGPGVTVIDRDPLAFGANAEAIAKGTAVVRNNS